MFARGKVLKVGHGAQWDIVDESNHLANKKKEGGKWVSQICHDLSCSDPIFCPTRNFTNRFVIVFSWFPAFNSFQR